MLTTVNKTPNHGTKLLLLTICPWPCGELTLYAHPYTINFFHPETIHTEKDCE